MKRISILTNLFVVLSVYLICSCKSTSDSGLNGYQDFRENADSIRFADFKVVRLQSESPLGEVAKLSVTDSIIFVKTIDALYSFDMDGGFVAQYGVKGRASNEYQYVTTFYVDTEAKQVCLIDATQEKLLYFKYDGTFLRKASFEGLAEKILYDAHLLPDNRLFVHNRVFGNSGNLFSILDLKDGSQKDFRPVSISTDDVAETCGEKMFNVYNGRISYLMPFEPYVYSFENNEETVRYKFADVGKVLNRRKQKKIKDYSIYKAFELTEDGVFAGFSGIYETSSFVFLNELTEYSYCILDKGTNKFRRYHYSISNDDDECTRLPIISIKCSYGDWLIGMGSPMKLLQYKSVDITGNDPDLKMLESVIESTSFDSDPVLFFYKIASI